MQHQSRSPQNIRIENRHRDNEEVWASPEWKAAVKETQPRHPYCCFCGDPSQVPHHDRFEVYGKPEYLDLDDTRWMCHTCHRGTHKGRFQCPICRKVRSKLADTPCYRCVSSGDKQGITENKRARNDAKNRYNRKRYRQIRGPAKVVDTKTGKWVIKNESLH